MFDELDRLLAEAQAAAAGAGDEASLRDLEVKYLG